MSKLFIVFEFISKRVKNLRFNKHKNSAWVRYSMVLIFLLSSCIEQKRQIIKVINDNQHVGTYYLDSRGLITKFAVYDSLSAKEEIYTYIYDKPDRLKKINYAGDGEASYFDEELERKFVNDAIYRNAFLKQKGINFPLPLINSSEIGDMSMVFSVSGDYQTTDKGIETVICFDSIYKRINFRSLIEIYIPHLTVIEKYKVTLDRNVLSKEEYFFEHGVLVRNYVYDERNRLISILSNCIYDSDPDRYSEVKNFDYLVE